MLPEGLQGQDLVHTSGRFGEVGLETELAEQGFRVRAAAEASGCCLGAEGTALVHCYY